MHTRVCRDCAYRKESSGSNREIRASLIDIETMIINNKYDGGGQRQLCQPRDPIHARGVVMWHQIQSM
jgi:hypothetical protein